MRKRFGLNSSPAYVQSLQGKPGLDIGYLGVPVTAAEVAVMTARNRAGLRIAAISAMLTTTHSDTFGGAWLEQSRLGVVVIASKQPTTVDLEAVQRFLPHGARAVTRRVSASYAYLNQLDGKLFSDPALHVSGSGGAST